MLFGERKTVKLRVDKILWERAKRSAGIEDEYDDTKALNKIVRQNRKYSKKVTELQRRLDDSSKLNTELQNTAEELKNRLNSMEQEHRRWESEKFSYQILERNYEKLKADYEHLKSKYDELKDKPIVRVKEVYREDTKRIKELAEKNDRLQKKVWEKVKKIEELNKHLREVNERLREIDEWKIRNYGLLVRLKSKGDDISGSDVGEIELVSEFISLGEYNKWLRDKDGFLKDKSISPPIEVIDVGRDLP